MPNAIVIDPHSTVRKTVCNILENASGFDEVRAAPGGAGGLLALRDRPADLVVMDLQLDDLPGDAVLEEVVSTWPVTCVLVLSAQRRAAERALLGGAHGYIDKGAGLDGLADAVRALMNGYAAFPLNALPTFRRAAANPADPKTLLSRRELTVLRLLAVGHSNKAISDVLEISNKTVSSHKASIMDKLGLGSLIDLAEFARVHRLLPVEGEPVPRVAKPRIRRNDAAAF
ncbi:response regulator transcription factor [Cupriavidus sp. EM10]|jgi:DNA-binding NarL/FixJ family response regulator|uniref:response regulator transcription factor n=1 Tax=Cupriavidus sp. EM10 TaxID=2839983 RepID=UPI001C003FC7|nr:response regulator transcription factor [Cupriavidus sp. EM10]QWE94864.1 response regulator transcription factor [Cupriavidus sp. EM10]